MEGTSSSRVLSLVEADILECIKISLKNHWTSTALETEEILAHTYNLPFPIAVAIADIVEEGEDQYDVILNHLASSLLTKVEERAQQIVVDATFQSVLIMLHTESKGEVDTFLADQGLFHFDPQTNQHSPLMMKIHEVVDQIQQEFRAKIYEEVRESFLR